MMIVLIISNQFVQKSVGYWFDFDAIGTDGDHVHIFVGAAPRYSPSKVMQIVKSITAREFFKKFP
jgi:putative transposase